MMIFVSNDTIWIIARNIIGGFVGNNPENRQKRNKTENIVQDSQAIRMNTQNLTIMRNGAWGFRLKLGGCRGFSRENLRVPLEKQFCLNIISSNCSALTCFVWSNFCGRSSVGRARRCQRRCRRFEPVRPLLFFLEMPSIGSILVGILFVPLKWAIL